MRKKVKTKRVLFDPDKIATAISQNLNRDLSTFTQMYGGGNSLQAFVSKVQRESCLKKYDPTVSDPDRLEKEAFAKFLEVNERMAGVNAGFPAPRSLPNRDLTPIELSLKRARCLTHWVLGDITWREIADNVSHSGGATLGVPFRDTSIDAKFTYPMTGTRKAISLFKIILQEDECLSRAIQDLNSNQQIAEEYEETEMSRATTVPKTHDKRRMIAIEPTLNMYFQQSLMAVMYKRLKSKQALSYVDLDVESLPLRHQKLAWEGSISGKVSTIDFSSASDCVSIELLRYLLPPKWFEYVSAFRCPMMNISGEATELHMISTMGNAGTFPLETLVFWVLGVAAVMQRTRCNPNSLLSLPEERAMVSVFGDDCILPTSDAQFFMNLAEVLGFTVNEEKSFFTDTPGFRESCGGDFFHGSNVRPFYIKAPTSTRMSALEPWLYVICNAVLQKYESYFGSLTYAYDKALLEYLFGLFRENKLMIKLVPHDFPDDSGLKTKDWERLRACYGLRFSPVARSEQGWYTFQFLQFRYRERKTKNEYLRYAGWLRNPLTQNEWWRIRRRPDERYPVRRKGGYVVARTLVPNWDM